MFNNNSWTIYTIPAELNTFHKNHLIKIFIHVPPEIPMKYIQVTTPFSLCLSLLRIIIHLSRATRDFSFSRASRSVPVPRALHSRNETPGKWTTATSHYSSRRKISSSSRVKLSLDACVRAGKNFVARLYISRRHNSRQAALIIIIIIRVFKSEIICVRIYTLIL